MTTSAHTPAHSPEPFTDRDLAARIADACVLRGQFTLRSGRTSTYYIDKYRFSTRPELLGPVADRIAHRLAAIERDTGAPLTRLAGAELGGIPLVTVAALRTGKPAVFVRNSKKDYGTAQQLEGVLEPGDRVVLIEDVATTAGQALEAVAALRDAGAEVVGIIATIDRLEGARDNVERAGLRFEAIFTTRDLGIQPDA